MANMQGLLAVYPSIAHDSAALGYQLAVSDPKFASMDARQQATTTAWYTSKLLLLALEQLQVIQSATIEEAKVRETLYTLRYEVMKEQV